MSKDKPFWKTKELSQMTEYEWDSLCDGCAKCCLHKIEDETENAIYYTSVACNQLNINTCRCKNYSKRTDLVQDCVKLTTDNLADLTWLPKTCAYRLLNEGNDLYSWHPLITGDPNSVHNAGISINDRCIVETETVNIEDHIVSWLDDD